MSHTESKIRVRVTRDEDAQLLRDWLAEPGILRWFPMFDQREIEDSIRIWMNYVKYEACFTAEWEGVPCGMATLYLQPFQKLAHQSLFAIIVNKEYRNKGIGSALLRAMMKEGKERLKLEILHLEVYTGNPAINLYRRMGFTEFGYQKHFVKDQGEYLGKIFMQKIL